MEKVRTKANRQRRANRTRTKIASARPRMNVIISNKHVSIQIIDDAKGVTLVSVTSVGKDKKVPANLTERARWAGEQIAKSAKKAKINRVVLDRGSKRYHGRIAALASAARAGGLEF